MKPILKLLKSNAFISLSIFYIICISAAYSSLFHVKSINGIAKFGFRMQSLFPIVLELLLLFIFFIWAYQRHWIKKIYIGFFILCLIINGIQLNSSLMYSDFLIPEALDNLEYIRFVITKNSILLFILYAAAIMALFFSAKFDLLNDWTFDKRKKYSILLLSICSPYILSTILLFFLWHPKKVPYYPLYDSFRSPTQAFIETLWTFSTTHTSNQKVSTENLRIFNSEISPDSRYPLIHSNFYTKKNQYLKDTLSKPNIIVFFVESFSSRLCGAYNPELKDLTPNLNYFASNSLLVKNYFNHTAATYRGIQGQLCSMYPYHGGENGWKDSTKRKNLLAASLKSLPDILRSNGYHSTFLGSENEKRGGLDNMAKQLLHFDSIICETKILELIKDSKVNGFKNQLSDLQLFRSVNVWLEKNKSQKAPFFLSIYNVGTHAWFNTPNDGIKYGSGESNIYNVFHNFDHGFGIFWEYFKRSPYYNNTIVIVTADHCYPAVEEYIDLIKDETYAPYFVDKIPLMIYSPYHNFPKEYDTGISSSIDFAPTLLHLINYPNESNHFLGKSIFEEGTRHAEFAAIGDATYLLTSNGVRSKGSTSKEVIAMMKFKDYLNFLYSLELENRIWGKDISK